MPYGGPCMGYAAQEDKISYGADSRSRTQETTGLHSALATRLYNPLYALDSPLRSDWESATRDSSSKHKRVKTVYYMFNLSRLQPKGCGPARPLRLAVQAGRRLPSYSIQRATATILLREEVKLGPCAQLSEAGS